MGVGGGDLSVSNVHVDILQYKHCASPTRDVTQFFRRQRCIKCKRAWSRFGNANFMINYVHNMPLFRAISGLLPPPRKVCFASVCL